MHPRSQQAIISFGIASRKTSRSTPGSRLICASTSHAAAETFAAPGGANNPYPFPDKSRPTPHEIFHLPRSATAKDIKLRYYELARIYHPDSAVSRAYPVEEANQPRWNAISAAYDLLRHKRITASARPGWGSANSHSCYPSSGSSYTYPSAGTYAGRRTPWGGFDPDGNPRPHPDGLTEPFWMSEKTTVMMAVIIVISSSILMARAFVTSPTVAAAQHHLDAAYNLEQARRQGKEQGEKRRQELRAWIEEAGMKGTGSHIGKGRTKIRPPDDALDAQEVDDVMCKLGRTEATE